MNPLLERHIHVNRREFFGRAATGIGAAALASSPSTNPSAVAGTLGPEELAALYASIDPARIAEAHHYVWELTERIFGCPASIHEDHHADTGTLFFAVDVRPSGTVEELVEKCNIWFRQPIPALTRCGPDYVLHCVPSN